MDWIGLSGLLLALLLALAGLMKWVITWSKAQDQEQEERFNERISGLSSSVQVNNTKIDHLTQQLVDIHREMHDDFAKQSEIDLLRKEQREDFNNVFKKMSGISKALNQLIGAINGKVETDDD